ncbi:hypothetical protein JCM5353_000259 [Sporobolomyces roseus]
MPTEIKDNFQVGTKCVVVADCDLRGEITIGSGTVLQPRCTILAMSGPIILGSNNIVEENVVIVNRLKQPMVIGDNNLFEVGCRIESPSIGSNNTFGIRSRVSPHLVVESNCTIGAGCIVLPSPFPLPSLISTPPPLSQEEGGFDASNEEGSDSTMLPPPSSSSESQSIETLVSNTHVFGSENRRRKGTAEGQGQSKALFVKHLDYLRETLPRFHKLKMF